MRSTLAQFNLTGLRARLLGIVLLAVVPLAFIFVFYANVVNQEALSSARSDVRDNLARDIRSVQDLVAGSHATLETLGVTHAIQAPDWVLAQGNSDRLRTEHPSYATIAVADSDGHVRAASPWRRNPIDVSGDDLFKRAVAARRLVVSGYGLDPVTGRPAIRVGLPVYSARAQFIAFEWISFEPAEFRTKMNAGSAVSAETLLDGRGTVVARLPANSAVEGRVLPDAALVRQVLTTHEGEALGAASGNSPVSTYYSPVLDPATGAFYLMMTFSPDTLFATRQRVFAETLLGFGAFAFIALFGAWLVGTYSIYRPAQLLRQAARRMSEGDLSARAEFGNTNDEFGALRDGFNEMAQTLQAQVVELESTQRQLTALNADLDERVLRRTSELEASNHELEAFSYSVSHDLRSPLRAIDGFSLALLEDYRDKLDAEGRDDLQRVRDNATRMGKLIDSLLALSRLSRQEMNVQDVDMTALATESATALRDLEPDRNVAVAAQPGVHGQGDPTLLRNAIDNLIGNAWKFTSGHESARIEFGAEKIEGETVYFVKDDGAGFDMAYSDKLFGAFQRVHGQAEFPGMGIGLATTARIIRRHGGRIWAEGEPEKGATFWFTLAPQGPTVTGAGPNPRKNVEG